MKKITAYEVAQITGLKHSLVVEWATDPVKYGDKIQPVERGNVYWYDETDVKKKHAEKALKLRRRKGARHCIEKVMLNNSLSADEKIRKIDEILRGKHRGEK
jgi:hypothetical protein